MLIGLEIMITVILQLEILFLKSGGAISCLIQKQLSVVQSTTEAEGNYMVLNMTTQEAVWLRRMHDDPQQVQLTAPIIQ